MTLGACQFETLAWPDLATDDRAAWARMRALRPGLGSPFFHPAWCDAVQAARGDLEVARISAGGECVGFLPFHRGRLGALRPAGGPMSDAHGFVCATDAPIDAAAAVRALRGRSFRFGAAPGDDPALAGLSRRADGYSLDLSRGYDAYLEARRAAQPKAFRNLRARIRKLEAAVGEIRFVADDRDPATLERILDLKRAQYRRTGQIDVFRPPWTGRLLRDLAARNGPGLRGRMSTLWLDGRLATGHFGLQADGVLHYWFTAYDPELSHFSPGLVLLHRIAEAVAAEGMTRIDLGGGAYRFKQEFADLRIPLGAGRVEGRGLLARAGGGADALARRIARLPFGNAATLPQRALARFDRMISFNEPRTAA